MINGEDDLTFSHFVEKFNKKAAQKGVDMDLQFITEFSSTITELKKKLEIPTNDFIDIGTWHKVMEIIPKDITVKKDEKLVNGREFVLETLGYINNADNICIRNVSDEICAEIEFKPPVKKDIVFGNWYRVWTMVSPNVECLTQIHQELPQMTAEYLELLSVFNKRLEEVESAKKDVKSVAGIVKLAIAKLLKLSPQNEDYAVLAKEIVENLQPNLGRLLQRKGAVYYSLVSVRDAVRDYNKARMRWVEFLMFMRKTFKSDRRTSVNPKRMFGFFTSLKKDLVQGTKNLERKISWKKSKSLNNSSILVQS